jgi:hypothetical protein
MFPRKANKSMTEESKREIPHFEPLHSSGITPSLLRGAPKQLPLKENQQKSRLRTAGPAVCLTWPILVCDKHFNEVQLVTSKMYIVPFAFKSHYVFRLVLNSWVKNSAGLS